MINPSVLVLVAAQWDPHRFPSREEALWDVRVCGLQRHGDQGEPGCTPLCSG